MKAGEIFITWNWLIDIGIWNDPICILQTTQIEMMNMPQRFSCRPIIDRVAYNNSIIRPYYLYSLYTSIWSFGIATRLWGNNGPTLGVHSSRTRITSAADLHHNQKKKEREREKNNVRQNQNAEIKASVNKRNVKTPRENQTVEINNQ